MGGSMAVTPSEAPPLSMISPAYPSAGPAYPPRQAPPPSMVSTTYPQKQGSTSEAKPYLQLSDVSSTGYPGSHKPSVKDNEGYSLPPSWSGGSAKI